MIDPPPFEGCSRLCRPRGGPWRHTLIWGECEHAPESARPEPRISLFGPFRADDGEMSLGTTSFTIPEMAAKVEAALRQVGIRLGPNALAMLGRGETVALSGGEYAAMGLAVAMMLAEESGK